VPTKILGITQIDVIVKNAIEAALMDLRANPGWLDYAFASLPQDSLTYRTLGQATVDQAKQWFVNNFPNVVTGPVMDEMKLPIVVIEPGESSEAVQELSTGDVHWDATEVIDVFDSPILAGPFVPANYVTETGTITLAAALDVPVFAGQILIDYAGRQHVIEAVHSDTEIKLPDNTVADFTRAILKPAAPAWKVYIESASYKETCRVSIYTDGNPEHVLWLHSIVFYALLKYKEDLLEARGYERTVLSSTRTRPMDFGTGVMSMSRSIDITGYVRQYWPKSVHRTIDGVLFDQFAVIGAGDVPEPESNDTALWVGTDET